MTLPCHSPQKLSAKTAEKDSLDFKTLRSPRLRGSYAYFVVENLSRSFCRKFEVPGGRRGGLADRWRPDELLDQGMLTGKSQLELIVPVLELRWDLHEFGDQVIQTQVFQVRAF